MSTLSRLSNTSPTRVSSGLEQTCQKPRSVQPRPSESSPSHPLKNLLNADGFGSGKAGTGGTKDLSQKLEQLVQTVNKLAELLGSQGTNASRGDAGQSGGTPGLNGAPTGTPGQEQVQDLGAQGPVGGQPGTTDAKEFLGQGPHAKDKVYEEIAHDAPGLGEKNKALWDAAHKAGASDEEAAVMVAQQMQEGANDPTKSGGAENFGPMNLNRGLLKDFGGASEGDLQKLNENSGGKYTPEALEANAKAALTAMRNMGTERYLDHVRGGGSGYERPTERLPFAGPKTADDDTRRFGRNIANAAHHVLEDFKKDPSSISRDWRQAADIPYV